MLAGRDNAFGLQFSDEFNGSGADLFAAVDRHGIEGIVLKRRDSRYRAGRCDAWLKVKWYDEGAFEVIGVERTRTGEVNADRPLPLLQSPRGLTCRRSPIGWAATTRTRPAGCR